MQFKIFQIKATHEKTETVYFPKFLLLLLFLFVLANFSPKYAFAESTEFLTKIFTLDRIYKSMRGPSDNQDNIYLIQNPQTAEMIWVTGFQADIVGVDGKTPVSEEFMCHVQVAFQRMDEHEQFFNNDVIYLDFLSLSQGQFEVHFPSGFGFPLMSNQPLELSSQVQNINYEDKTHKVRYKVSVNFIRDKAREVEMKPLMIQRAFSRVLVKGDNPHFRVKNPNGNHGPGSIVGEPATNDTSYNFRWDGQNKYAMHWIVPPGRQVNHSVVTSDLDLQFDTTIHYIYVHLHPYGESVELRDLTTGQSIYKSEARNSKGKAFIEHIDHFTSTEGIPIFKDHEYELISTYNNTTSENSDAMAVMYIYVLDKDFQRPLNLVELSEL